MIVLKDKNLISINQDSKSTILDINSQDKDELLEQMKKDSMLLKEMKLIDYSVFLIQVDLSIKNISTDKKKYIYNSEKDELTLDDTPVKRMSLHLKGMFNDQL